MDCVVNQIRDQIVNFLDDPQKKLLLPSVTEHLLRLSCRPDFIDPIINSNLIIPLVKLLNNSPSVQITVTQILINVTAGTSEQIRAVADDVIPTLIKLLITCKHTDVVKQAVWALGNIIGDGGPELRDLVIEAGISRPLTVLIKTPGLVREVIRTISSLFRYKNLPPPIDVVNQFLPILSQFMFHTDVCIRDDHVYWTLLRISDTNAQEIVDKGIVPLLVELLGGENYYWTSTAVLAVAILGKIIARTGIHTDTVLEAGALALFPRLLIDPNEQIAKLTVWIISNIAAGTREHIRSLFDTPDLFSRLSRCLTLHKRAIWQETAWTISNILSGGSIFQVLKLMEDRILVRFCKLLSTSALHTDLLLNILDVIGSILDDSLTYRGLYANEEFIGKCRELSIFRKLQQHEDGRVSNIARYLSSHLPLPQPKLKLIRL